MNLNPEVRKSREARGEAMIPERLQLIEKYGACTRSSHLDEIDRLTRELADERQRHRESKDRSDDLIELLADSLYEHIKHGDEDHRRWLKEQALIWAKVYFGAKE